MHRTEEEKEKQEHEEMMIKYNFNDAAKTIEGLKGLLNVTVQDLDVKLDRVLKKQEHDYLRAYSIYVHNKEKELRKLVE